MSVTRAWMGLMALSLASTALAYGGAAGVWAALAILALAWAKAQLILNRYLGLSQAPNIAWGMALVLATFMAGVMGLAIAGG